jgi:hypothetical protein
MRRGRLLPQKSCHEKLPRKGCVFGAIVCSGAAFRSSPKVKGKNIFDMWWSELWPPGHERLTVTAQYRVLFNRCWPIDCVFWGSVAIQICRILTMVNDRGTGVLTKELPVSTQSRDRRSFFTWLDYLQQWDVNSKWVTVGHYSENQMPPMVNRINDQFWVGRRVDRQIKHYINLQRFDSLNRWIYKLNWQIYYKFVG